MAIRPSVVQVFELGMEAQQGTEVAPSRQLRSLTWDFTPQAEIDDIRASGFKYTTMTATNREWSTGSIGGEPDYNEITYLLNSVINQGSAVAIGTASGDVAYQWLFDSDSDGLDTFQTYSAVKGDANHAEKVTGLIVDSFTLDVTRQDATISGSFLAGRMNDGTAVSGTAAFIGDTQRPILPGHFDIYLDDTDYTDFGNTQLDYDFRFMFEISGRHTPVWPLKSSNDSYGFTVEGPPTVGATLQMMADDVTNDILDAMRLNSTVYVRAQATGAAWGGENFQLTIDAALQVISAPTMSDLDDVYVAEWGFRAVHDGDWGRAFQVTLVNALEIL